MSEDKKKSGWESVNRVVGRQKMEESLPLSPMGLEAKGQGIQHHSKGAPVSPEGVIQSMKANKITQKAALEFLDSYYEKQLEAARHHLNEAVRVRKADSTSKAEQFLELINAQQLHFLTQVGLRNEGARTQAMIQLGEQTAAALRQVDGADWPDNIKDLTIEGILNRQRVFFQRLMTELGTA